MTRKIHELINYNTFETVIENYFTKVSSKLFKGYNLELFYKNIKDIEIEWETNNIEHKPDKWVTINLFTINKDDYTNLVSKFGVQFAISFMTETPNPVSDFVKHLFIYGSQISIEPAKKIITHCFNDKMYELAPINIDNPNIKNHDFIYINRYNISYLARNGTFDFNKNTVNFTHDGTNYVSLPLVDHCWEILKVSDMNHQVTMDYFDEASMKSESVEIEKLQIDLAKKIKKYLDIKMDPMVARDKQSLVMRVDLSNDRIERELGKNCYLIKIERIYGNKPEI